MRLTGRHERHLTYCTNVHPGETWAALRDDVLPRVVEVKERLIAAGRAVGSFGVGLRMSAQAATELANPEALADLTRRLAQHGLYVFTINGFPYGNFHGQAVKSAVYDPDWRTEQRLEYSNRLAELLAALLPAEVSQGSISTVPLGFRPSFAGAADFVRASGRIVRHLAHLHRLEARTGKRITLALEPEPCCALETIDDCVRFFDQFMRSAAVLAELAAQLPGDADPHAVLQRHLGICLDACHAAVEFEDVSALLAALRVHRIPIYKVQLSAGLRVADVDAAARSALEPFAEDVYLHQVVERRGGELVRYLDLRDALEARAPEAPREWRVHFHVPLFATRFRHFESTQPFLRELCAALAASDACQHFEVETYTWSVLPLEARGADMIADIASELSWVLRDSGLNAEETR
jgi:hypothetical protein